MENLQYNSEEGILNHDITLYEKSENKLQYKSSGILEIKLYTFKEIARMLKEVGWRYVRFYKIIRMGKNTYRNIFLAQKA